MDSSLSRDRSRSRSPRRNTDQGFTNFLGAEAKALALGFSESTTRGVARRGVEWLWFSPRKVAIIKAAMLVLDCHNQCERDASKFGSADWAQVGASAIDDLGGLVKKISQFVTQDAAATPDPAARRHFRMLLGGGKPRSMDDIRLQMVSDGLFDAETVNSIELLGVGCAAEVSMVQTGLGIWAVKTVNPTSQERFQSDVEMLVSFAALVNKYLVPLSRGLGAGATADHMMVVVDRVNVLANDCALIQSQMKQFDLSEEATNTTQAMSKLMSTSLAAFVPLVTDHTKTSMKMLAISGQQADSFDFKQFPEFAHHLVQVYGWMLQNGFFHMDLHQGNILMVPRSVLEADVQKYQQCCNAAIMQQLFPWLLCILDWAEVLRIPAQQMEDFMVIVRCSLELGMEVDGQDSLCCIFERLGIRRKNGEALDEDICKVAVQDMSILTAMSDDVEHKKELALRIAPLEFVGWWHCLTKANGALANSLSGCGCKRDEAQRLFAKYLT